MPRTLLQGDSRVDPKGHAVGWFDPAAGTVLTDRIQRFLVTEKADGGKQGWYGGGCIPHQMAKEPVLRLEFRIVRIFRQQHDNTGVVG